MTDQGKKPPTGEHQVGYGRPPVHTRFRKGQSGNPSGQPRGITAGRLMALVLKEAYRMVRIKERDRVFSLPAIHAILRAQVTHAAKGSGPAQRAVIGTVQAIEQKLATQAAAEAKDKATERPVSNIGAARLIGRLLNKAAISATSGD